MIRRFLTTVYRSACEYYSDNWLEHDETTALTSQIAVPIYNMIHIDINLQIEPTLPDRDSTRRHCSRVTSFKVMIRVQLQQCVGWRRLLTNRTLLIAEL